MGTGPRHRRSFDRAAVLNAARNLDGSRQSPQSWFAAARAATAADLASLPIYREMLQIGAAWGALGIANPYFHLLEGRASATAIVDQRPCINFASYDYLGLNSHPEVAAAAELAIREYGTSVSASRPTAGDRPLHRQLESELALHYRAEAALVFVSGHATNVSVIGDLLTPKDLILYDALSHNSIVVGARLASGARRVFPHNDLDALERILSQSRSAHERVLIVVEGLYSMDGDLPDLPRLVDLKERYNALLMVDEAHAIGTVGATGKGVFEHFDVDPAKVDIWMGTLSKTLAGCGGYIASSSIAIDILKYHASAFMFSVGMSPPVAAASLAALRLIPAAVEKVRRAQANAQFFLDKARGLKLNTGHATGRAVVPVIVGDSLRAAKLAERLLDRGVFTIPVTYPAVAMKSARLRFFITSEHQRDQLELAATATREELDKLEAEGFGMSMLSQITAP